MRIERFRASGRVARGSAGARDLSDIINEIRTFSRAALSNGSKPYTSPTPSSQSHVANSAADRYRRERSILAMQRDWHGLCGHMVGYPRNSPPPYGPISSAPTPEFALPKWAKTVKLLP
jgi:hypothetical protein